VQEYNSPVQYKNDCFIGAMPLGQNCISISEDLGRYWMNTPLNAEEKQREFKEY
jgi:hypothetical protein